MTMHRTSFDERPFQCSWYSTKKLRVPLNPRGNKAPIMTDLAQVSLKFPRMILMSFLIRISSWLVISSLKPEKKEDGQLRNPQLGGLVVQPMRRCHGFISKHFKHFFLMKFLSWTANLADANLFHKRMLICFAWYRYTH